MVVRPRLVRVSVQPPADERLFAAKQALRVRSRRLRAALGREDRERASLAICRHLLDSQLYRRATTIGAYAAFGDEVDLSSLISSAPSERPVKRVALPRIVPDPDRILTLHLAPSAGLEPHPFGPLQPPADAPPVDPAELDLVLVPGLAFDRRGGRLGYGRGYYDRLLARLPADPPLVGVAFDATVVEHVPVAVHDVTMTHLVTESGLLELPSARTSYPTHGGS